MKRIVASVSLVALGVAGVQAQSEPMAVQQPKPWNVSATLRGFYDDNINSTTSGRVGSAGVEISPSVGVNWGDGQTTIVGNYTYSLKYYDKRPAGNGGNADQEHIFDIALSHAFSPRYRLDVEDNFVVGQEPDALRSGPSSPTIQRIAGDNIRNTGLVKFNMDLSPQLSLELGYENDFFDYADNTVLIAFNIVTPSRSGMLDRIEQYGHVNLKWHATPETTPFAGYKFGLVNYTSDQIVAETLTFAPIQADQRDSRSHFVYAGVQHSFRPDLRAVVQVGAQYRDPYNDPASKPSTTPYVDGNVSYAYLPNDVVTAGFTYARSASDQVGSGGHLVVDYQTAVLYGSLHHEFLPQLSGDLSATFQNSSADASGTTVTGSPTKLTDRQDYLLGLILTYAINQNFSVHAGYSYDRQDGSVGAFDRNRVYIGATARY